MNVEGHANTRSGIKAWMECCHAVAQRDIIAWMEHHHTIARRGIKALMACQTVTAALTWMAFPTIAMALTLMTC